MTEAFVLGGVRNPFARYGSSLSHIPTVEQARRVQSTRFGERDGNRSSKKHDRVRAADQARKSPALPLRSSHPRSNGMSDDQLVQARVAKRRRR